MDSIAAFKSCLALMDNDLNIQVCIVVPLGFGSE
jgi:hypothetical protein